MATRPGSKSRYETELLAELKEFPEEEQAKLLRLIQFLKEEILRPKGEGKEEVLRHAGLLADLTPEEEERFTEAVRRRSLFGKRQVRL